MGEPTEETKEETKDITEKDTELDTEKSDEKKGDTPDDVSAVKQESPEMNMEEMYERSLKQIHEGELITGEIIKIEDEFVLVDIGYKSEGSIPINEFKASDGNIAAKIGDKVDVVLERKENEDGRVMLSMERAKKIKVWDHIRDLYNTDGTIQGKVISKVKGGLSVDIGLPAFLPGSQIDLHPIRNLDSLVGQVMDLKILKYNKKRNNIIISRRAILEAGRMKQKAKTLALIEEGSIFTGTVKNITDYGLFIDLGGLDGLLHITDMSWGRVAHPSSMYKIGDEITVKVISFDRERERVSLGLKQLKPDPWVDANTRFPVGTKVTGRVVNLTDYGAFVEIEEGIEGLIHISEMSWTKKVKHPSQIVNVGEELEAVVLNLDTGNKRVSLGMKQVKPNPWDLIAEKYPVGTIIEGRIKNITDFGIFIGIDEDIDGLVHISDISWTKKIKHPGELYKKADEVQAKVLSISKENERFSLGIKQLTKDPWEDIPEKYKAGTKVTGRVTNITDFGIFVELEEGIEGLIHSSEISKSKSKSSLGKFQIDDVIQALVVHVSQQDKKIGLSIRKLQDKEFRDIYDDFKDGVKETPSTFGMLIKEKMEEAHANLPSQEGEKVTDKQEPPGVGSDDAPAEEASTEKTESTAEEKESLVEEDTSLEEDTSSEEKESSEKDKSSKQKASSKQKGSAKE
ncbi:MAG: 30S ribosomal protein S1 [Deltaproteobacteria bacterium]|nr:MAG: 30S ribosomal protein S1 [Deltaproteobacteria bacterium]